MDKSPTLRAEMGDNRPAVCIAVKTKQIDMRTAEEKAHPLDSNDDKEPQTVCYENVTGGGGTCYALEGNTVDRASRKNGRGWCENVSPTLNTQDRHAVVFRKASRHANDKSGERWEEDPVCGTLNGFEYHSDIRTPEVVCLEGNGSRPSHLGGGYNTDGKSYTLNTIERHAVCYAVDCRNDVINEEISGTLQAHNIGGWSVSCTNPVMYERREDD